MRIDPLLCLLSFLDRLIYRRGSRPIRLILFGQFRNDFNARRYG
jgi:hypothetical protein